MVTLEEFLQESNLQSPPVVRHEAHISAHTPPSPLITRGELSVGETHTEDVLTFEPLTSDLPTEQT